MINPYLSDFLSIPIWGHLKNIFVMLFGVRGSIAFYCFTVIIVGLIFIALASVISLIISEFEEKHKDKKWIILLDIVVISIYAILGSLLMNSYSMLRAGISSEGSFYGSPFRGLVYYRQNIGVFCSILYSFLINHRLLKKYLVKLKIDKYGKVIFSSAFVVFFVVAYYFYFLCQALSA